MGNVLGGKQISIKDEELIQKMENHINNKSIKQILTNIITTNKVAFHCVNEIT